MIRIALVTAAALIGFAAAMPAQAGQTWNGQTWNGQTWNGSAISGGIVGPTLVDIELPRR